MVTRKDPGDRGDKIASLCRLNEVLGVAEECPEEACPFWEPGGAVLSGRCAFEGLAAFGGRRDLAGFLLRIREGLHSAENRRKARGASPLLPAAERGLWRLSERRRL